MKRLAESVTSSISYNRIANLIKGTGTSTTTTSVIQYVEQAKDAYIILSIENYASKSVEKETVKKHYFIDNGLLSIFFSNTTAPLLENLCAIHLYKKYENNLYYYNTNIEVDFFIPEMKYAIQVCANISEELTRQREIAALERLDSFEGLNRIPVYEWLTK